MWKIRDRKFRNKKKRLHKVYRERLTDLEKNDSFRKLTGKLSEMIEDNPKLAAMLWAKDRKDALTDGLTGLYNKRYMDRKMKTEIAIRERYIEDGKKPPNLTLILFDLDNLKAVNDGRETLGGLKSGKGGHDAGDRYLISMAKSISSKIRPVDRAIRFGGDEFAAIIQADLGVAEKIVNRIKKDFEKRKKKNYLPSYTGFSSGATSWKEKESPEDLFKRADRKLYDEKNEKKRENEKK